MYDVLDCSKTEIRVHIMIGISISNVKFLKAMLMKLGTSGHKSTCIYNDNSITVKRGAKLYTSES